MDQSETPKHLASPRIAARRSYGVVFGALCATSLLACNVYDSSLLQSSLSTGGTSAGSSSGSAGGASSFGGTFAIGGSGDAAGAGHAGSSHAGDTGEGGMAGADPGVGGSWTSVGGSAGTHPGGGTGGVFQSGGGGSGGAVNLGSSMIDDMEDQDRYIGKTAGRVGGWYLTHEAGKGGTQTPATSVVPFMAAIPSGRAGSMYAFHTTATGTPSGALVGLDLNNKTARSVYDASAYSALHFWAKVGVGSATAIKLTMPDSHTDPMGGQCNKVSGAGQCYDHFATDFTLTTEWKEYWVKLADLSQVGWGGNQVDALDLKNVYGIEISWLSAAMDLWIDDIEFINKG